MCTLCLRIRVKQLDSTCLLIHLKLQVQYEHRACGCGIDLSGRHCVAEWAILYRSVDDATDADVKARCFDTETACLLL